MFGIIDYNNLLFLQNCFTVKIIFKHTLPIMYTN